MTTTPKTGDGNVAIMLSTADGSSEEEITLRPTLNAAQAISRTSEGIMGSIRKCLDLNIDEITRVISLGMGYTGQRRPPSDLPERVWRTGLTDERGGVVDRVVYYLRVLANGGHPPREDDWEASQDTKNPQ